MNDARDRGDEKGYEGCSAKMGRERGNAVSCRANEEERRGGGGERGKKRENETTKPERITEQDIRNE